MKLMKQGRANLVLEEEDESICLGKQCACMLTVNKTGGSLTRPDLNLPVVEKKVIGIT